MRSLSYRRLTSRLKHEARSAAFKFWIRDLAWGLGCCSPESRVGESATSLPSHETGTGSAQERFDWIRLHGDLVVLKSGDPIANTSLSRFSIAVDVACAIASPCVTMQVHMY